MLDGPGYHLLKGTLGTLFCAAMMQSIASDGFSFRWNCPIIHCSKGDPAASVMAQLREERAESPLDGHSPWLDLNGRLHHRLHNLTRELFLKNWELWDFSYFSLLHVYPFASMAPLGQGMRLNNFSFTVSSQGACWLDDGADWLRCHHNWYVCGSTVPQKSLQHPFFFSTESLAWGTEACSKSHIGSKYVLSTQPMA